MSEYCVILGYVRLYVAQGESPATVSGFLLYADECAGTLSRYQSMARIAEEDFTDAVGKCSACGSDVDLYVCNDALFSARPASADCDRWMLCVNAACEHHYGEDIGQFDPDWLIRS